MSYDLVIMPKRDGQSWTEALEAEPSAARAPVDPAVWDVVVKGAREILGDVRTDDEGGERRLTHQQSGIMVTCRADAATVSVPFWYTGAQAEAVVDALYRVANTVATATGMAAYDPQLELPLAQAQTRRDAAVAVFDQAAEALAQLAGGEGFEVYFTGDFTLADAARQLKSLVVAEEQHRFTVRWGEDGPPMWVTFAAGPEVAADSDGLAETYGIAELAGHDRRYQVTFDDLGEVLDDINTMIEVQLGLQELTGGYVVRSWNSEVSLAEA
jgi:hypothetical protein